MKQATTKQVTDTAARMIPSQLAGLNTKFPTQSPTALPIFVAISSVSVSSRATGMIVNPTPRSPATIPGSGRRTRSRSRRGWSG